MNEGENTQELQCSIRDRDREWLKRTVNFCERVVNAKVPVKPSTSRFDETLILSGGRKSRYF